MPKRLLTKQPQSKTTQIEAPTSPHSAEEMNQIIAARAYELYQQRGGADGQELDDWLSAESEVLAARQMVPDQPAPQRIEKTPSLPMTETITSQKNIV